MRDTEKSEFVKLITVSLKLYDKTIDPEVMSLWWAVLSKFDLGDVRQALSIHIETDKFAPKPAHIIAILKKPEPDGRPSSDEAWAMIPRDEAASCVITEEMAEAYGIAKPLLDAKDQIAARMSFKAAYERIVEENRTVGTAPKWFPSLGHDKAGRDTALAEAVRLGRLGTEHAMSLTMKPETLAIEDKSEISPEKVRANLAKLKMALYGKVAKQQEAA